MVTGWSSPGNETTYSECEQVILYVPDEATDIGHIPP